MLKELRIKNFAIIDDLTVRFEQGLNVLTGETGAGKSIVVDALGLALGDRAQADQIKSGEKEASVQAYFEMDSSVMLPDLGIDTSEGLFLRRVLTSSGKSRAYINDVMVTLQTLAEVGRSIIDIHGQHEHQSLHTAEKQRLMLDAYGSHADEIKKVKEFYETGQSLKDEYNALTEKVKERAHKIDLLSYQIREIDMAALRPGEKEELEEEKRILANLSKLRELTETAYALLYEGEGSCTEKLSSIVSKLKDTHTIDASIEEVLKLTESALPLVEDAAILLRAFKDKYDMEPERLEAVDDRLELIRKLEKKYGESIEKTLEFRKNAADELKGIEASDERLKDVERGLTRNNDDLLKAAKILSEKRQSTAQKIEKLVNSNLRDLAFSNAIFKIDVSQEISEDGKYKIGSNGTDRIEYVFSANPGEPLKPLSKIASGGELSRIMLALKSILADVDNVPVLIFDEVDAGIGGRAAESVGKKLKKISGSHQLLCITHLPQIAIYGDFHLRIDKKTGNNKVSVKIEELSVKERHDEIARMLSGKVTEISLRHAEELLERVKQE